MPSTSTPNEKSTLPPGDKLLIRANDKGQGLINGQVLTVAEVDANGSIATQEAIRIPTGFRRWCHGYAITSHNAQRRTCDHAIVAADKLGAKAASNKQRLRI